MNSLNDWDKQKSDLLNKIRTERLSSQGGSGAYLINGRYLNGEAAEEALDPEVRASNESMRLKERQKLRAALKAKIVKHQSLDRVNPRTIIDMQEQYDSLDY